MFDLDLLAESADPLEIADAIGMKTKRKGKNVYCECPSHRRLLGRADENIGNCVLTPHGYHCFACNTSGNVFTMVMDFCNCSFGEAIKKVARITGGDFSIKETKKSDNKQPFSSDDLALIGLTSLANPKGDAGREILGVLKTRPESGVFFRRGDEYVTYASVQRITLNQLYQENAKLYYQMIAENAEIALKKYQSLYMSFEDRGGKTFEMLFNILADNDEVDTKLISEIKNVLLLNIKRTERLLKEAKSRASE